MASVARAPRAPLRSATTRAELGERIELQRRARAATIESVLRWLESAGYPDAAVELRRAALPPDEQLGTWHRAKLEALLRVQVLYPRRLLPAAPEHEGIRLASDLEALASFAGGKALVLLGAASLDSARELVPTSKQFARFYNALGELALAVLDVTEPEWRRGDWLLDETDEP